MKPILYITVLFCLFCSCSPIKHYYLYSNIDSRSADINKTDTGIFKLSGDSLDVYYSFSGDNISVKMTIFNKTNHSLFIDWNNSWLTINRSDYKINFSEYLEPTLLSYPIYHQTKREYQLLKSAYFKFNQIEKTNYEKNKVVVSGKTLTMQGLNFTDITSPLVISSHLSVFVNTIDEERISLDTDFYVSQINKVNKCDFDYLKSVSDNSGDRFFISFDKDKKSNPWVGSVLGALLETVITSKGLGETEN